MNHLKKTEVQVNQVNNLASLNFIFQLFDQYRKFYSQPSNIKDAKIFLTERFEKSESVLFFATVNGIPAGFCQLYPCFSSVSMKRLWILNDLFVAADFRKQGIGRALLDKSVQFAVKTQSKGLVLETAVTNLSAQRLYEDAGWRRDNEYYRYGYFL